MGGNSEVLYLRVEVEGFYGKRMGQEVMSKEKERTVSGKVTFA